MLYKHLLRCGRLRYKDICQKGKSRVQHWLREARDDPEIPAGRVRKAVGEPTP